MRGLMMDYPLTLPALLDARRNLRRCGDRLSPAGPQAGAVHMGKSLPPLAAPGERAYRAWPAPRRSRGHAAVESVRTHGSYFGVPIAGGVLHTLNLRLHPDEIAYIANHAGDRFLIVDDVLLPFMKKSATA